MSRANAANATASTVNAAINQAQIARMQAIAAISSALEQNVYLEEGPSNRLALSLNSGLPDEIDFALEHLLHSTYAHADLLHFDTTSGLAEGLIACLSALATFERKVKRPPRPLQAQLSSHKQSQARRRAIEAAIVLRNLALLPRNLFFVTRSPYLQAAIVDLLEIYRADSIAKPGTEEESWELQIILLDLLDMISPAIVLRRPPAPGEAVLMLANNPDADVPEQTDPRCRIFDTVSPLVHSSDRAICLGAFKVLATLAGHETVSERNEAIFTFPSTSPIISRALELLFLQDAELTFSILEFLYAYTRIPPNVDSFASRPDTAFIFRLLLSKLAVKALRHDTEVEPYKAASERVTREARLRLAIKEELDRPLSTVLTPQEYSKLALLQEPRRTVLWMQWVYELNEKTEITQVDLWKAYKTQFDTPHESMMPLPTSLAAADVIKLASEAYSSANAQVISLPSGEKKFVIRGIRVRDRKDLIDVIRQKWADPNSANSSDPLARAPANMTTAPISDADVLGHALGLFLESHVTLPGSSILARLNAVSPSQDPFTIKQSTWTVPEGENGSLTGTPYFAALILRNMARAIRAATTPARKIEVEGESIFNILSGARKRVDTGLYEFKEANVNSDALIALERDILQLAISYKNLTTIFSEILGCIAALQEMKSKDPPGIDVA